MHVKDQQKKIILENDSTSRFFKFPKSHWQFHLSLSNEALSIPVDVDPKSSWLANTALFFLNTSRITGGCNNVPPASCPETSIWVYGVIG